MSIRKWLLFCLLLTLFGSCSDSEHVRSAGENSLIQVGDTLPAFSVTASDGSQYSNLSLKGSASVIVFFNTDCSDCRQELPQIEKAYKSFQDNPDVKWLAISREESSEAVSSYWATAGLDLPYSAQQDRKVYNLFASQDIPRIYIADRQGRVHFIYSDVEMPDENTFSEAVRACLP